MGRAFGREHGGRREEVQESKWECQALEKWEKGNAFLILVEGCLSVGGGTARRRESEAAGSEEAANQTEFDWHSFLWRGNWSAENEGGALSGGREGDGLR